MGRHEVTSIGPPAGGRPETDEGQGGVGARGSVVARSDMEIGILTFLLTIGRLVTTPAFATEVRTAFWRDE